MKKRLGLIVATGIFFMTFLFSCNSNSDKEAESDAVNKPEQETEETIDTLLTNETIKFFDQSGYSDYAKSRMRSFDWSRFRLVDTWKDDSLIKSNFNPDSNYFKLYGKFLKYSPDSSLFIDLDSYNIVLSREDGKLVGHEEGPDTEVSLIDPKTKEKKRLVFLGPGGSIEEGGWLDEDNLVLIGAQYNDEGTTAMPMIWKYHLPTSTFYLYESPDSVGIENKLNNWRKERLQGIDLK